MNRTIGSWCSATGASVGVLLASGLAVRVADARLGVVHNHAIPRGTLNVLPMNFGSWTGRDVPLDPRIIRATDTDDHLNRLYAQPGVSESVSLYIAAGVKLRDLAPHRPEVCYPSAGWTLERREKVRFVATDGVEREAVLHGFRRGALQAAGITVLHYYIVNGERCADLSVLRSSWWRSSTRTKYSAQIQVSISCDERSPVTDKLVLEFAALAAVSIEAELSAAMARLAE